MLKVILVSFLFGSHAMAYSLESESNFSFGNVTVFNTPYYREDEVNLPINVDYSFDGENPALKSLCSLYTHVPVSQIVDAGANIWRMDGMLYDMKTDTFSPVPQPNTKYVGLRALTCQISGYPLVPLRGETIQLPDGSIKVNHPTVWLVDEEIAINIKRKEEAKIFCQILGYSDLESVRYSYSRRKPNIGVLELSIYSNPLNIETIRKESRNDLIKTVESIVCKK